MDGSTIAINSVKRTAIQLRVLFTNNSQNEFYFNGDLTLFGTGGRGRFDLQQIKTAVTQRPLEINV